MTPRRIRWFLSLQDVLLTTTAHIARANLFLRLLCIRPSILHIWSDPEALVITEHNFFLNHVRLSNKTCPCSSITSCMNIFTPSSPETCSNYAPWRLLRFGYTVFHHAGHTFSHGLSLTKPQVHSSWSWKQTNHFTICNFYFRNNCLPLVGVVIVNFLSHREESGLQWNCYQLSINSLLNRTCFTSKSLWDWSMKLDKHRRLVTQCWRWLQKLSYWVAYCKFFTRKQKWTWMHSLTRLD